MDKQETIHKLKSWSDQILDEDSIFEPNSYSRSLWVRGGKLRCVHCGRPIYCDDGPGNSSGYYFHIEQTDKMNGLYCWTPFGKGPTAFPKEHQVSDKEIAEAIRELLND